MYKVPEGKAENAFALGERCMPKSYAMAVIAETHKFWKDLTETNALSANGSGMKREGSGVCTHHQTLPSLTGEIRSTVARGRLV